MAVRLIWRKVAGQSYNLGDYLTMAAGVAALTRLGLIHVVLTWGTNNMTDAFRNTHHFTSREIYQRMIGSNLWLQKLVLLDLYRRLMIDMPYEKVLIRGFLFVFFATYVVVQVLTFSECKPFHLYWQVLPNPGECAAAQLQLIVLGVLNIVTDAMLLVLPVPVIFGIRAPWQRKLQLTCLFTLGIFIILITIIRLPINSGQKHSQISRTTWASTELLTSALVVNAPTLYGLWNKRRREKYESARKKGYNNYRPEGVENAVPTIGGSSGSYAMTPKRKPTSGILQTKEVIITEFRETRHSGEYIKLPEEVESVSNHSRDRTVMPH
ncbi:hypothetical protein PT974_04020 [Cladobotryum mycophilum]|uniref:Rhodopsin domain-containing protein n=1 Tax=Cladobotryum mycophilum TaxID=491253 RepID=A0ABR0STX2_9HYPO